jgi:hypothetical protein
LTRDEADERVRQIVRAWLVQVQSYPPEVQAAQTTLVVLREPDIAAMRILLAERKRWLDGVGCECTEVRQCDRCRTEAEP